MNFEIGAMGRRIASEAMLALALLFPFGNVGAEESKVEAKKPALYGTVINTVASDVMFDSGGIIGEGPTFQTLAVGGVKDPIRLRDDLTLKIQGSAWQNNYLGKGLGNGKSLSEVDVGGSVILEHENKDFGTIALRTGPSIWMYPDQSIRDDMIYDLGVNYTPKVLGGRLNADFYWRHLFENPDVKSGETYSLTLAGTLLEHKPKDGVAVKLEAGTNVSMVEHMYSARSGLGRVFSFLRATASKGKVSVIGQAGYQFTGSSDKVNYPNKPFFSLAVGLDF